MGIYSVTVPERRRLKSRIGRAVLPLESPGWNWFLTSLPSPGGGGFHGICIIPISASVFT